MWFRTLCCMFFEIHTFISFSVSVSLLAIIPKLIWQAVSSLCYHLLLASSYWFLFVVAIKKLPKLHSLYVGNVWKCVLVMNVAFFMCISGTEYKGHKRVPPVHLHGIQCVT